MLLCHHVQKSLKAGVGPTACSLAVDICASTTFWDEGWLCTAYLHLGLLFSRRCSPRAPGTVWLWCHHQGTTHQVVGGGWPLGLVSPQLCRDTTSSLTLCFFTCKIKTLVSLQKRTSENDCGPKITKFFWEESQ